MGPRAVLVALLVPVGAYCAFVQCVFSGHWVPRSAAVCRCHLRPPDIPMVVRQVAMRLLGALDQLHDGTEVPLPWLGKRTGRAGRRSCVGEVRHEAEVLVASTPAHSRLNYGGANFEPDAFGRVWKSEAVQRAASFYIARLGRSCPGPVTAGFKSEITLTTIGGMRVAERHTVIGL